MKRRLPVVIGILLSIALLFFALRDVSAAELLEHLGAANIWLLLAATVVATLTFHLRAIRWRVLLAPATSGISWSPRFAAVCIGFMVNNVLPARVGEFARAYSLSRIAPVRTSVALASLIVERLLDAIVMLAFLIPAIVLGGGDLTVSGTVRDLFTALIALVGAGLVTLGVLVRFPSPFMRFAERWSHRLAPEHLADRITGIIASFLAGLGALRHAHLFWKALLWSVVVWGWNAFSFYLGFMAFSIETPGITGAMLLQTVIGFAVAIPSTPGFFGPFEAATRVALGLYGVEPARIVSFAAGYHILTFIPITLLGIWYMRRLGLSREEIGRTARLRGESRESDAGDDPPAWAGVSAEGPAAAAPDGEEWETDASSAGRR